MWVDVSNADNQGAMGFFDLEAPKEDGRRGCSHVRNLFIISVGMRIPAKLKSENHSSPAETFTPVMRIVKFGEETAKYLPETDTVDEQSLRNFASGVIDGKIEV